MKITITDAIKELKREIALRERVYPKWIASGRLNKELAEKQMARMKAALQFLEEKKVLLTGKQTELF